MPHDAGQRVRVPCGDRHRWRSSGAGRRAASRVTRAARWLGRPGRSGGPGGPADRAAAEVRYRRRAGTVGGRARPCEARPAVGPASGGGPGLRAAAACAGRRRCRAGRRRADDVGRVADDFVVAAERHERVERMPGRDDIGDPGVERNPVERRMRLDEAPVRLLGQLGIHEIKRHDQVIQPRREVPERIRQLGCLEDQQRADHLHPGRPGLAPGADHDVARPEAEAEPPAAVLVRRLIVDRAGGHAASVAADSASGSPHEEGDRARLTIPGLPAAARRERLVTTRATSVSNVRMNLVCHSSRPMCSGGPCSLSLEPTV